MSNGIKAVVSYDLQINVRTSQGFDLLEVQDKKLFSWLKNAYVSTSEAITLKEIEARLNDYKKAQLKDLSECILKGLYKNGTSGVHNVKTAPFLFFDIDVKNTDDKKENIHLFDPIKNGKVFNYLKEVSVICWRSNSQTGIAGLLYVPQIAEFNADTSREHLAVGKAITARLSELIEKDASVKNVEFDQAQSKFRQVRYLAEQSETRQLNPNALTFEYTVKRIEKRTPDNIPIYHNENYAPSYGSIWEQFNNNNSILDVALNNGFRRVGSGRGNKVRIKHPLTTSSTSGDVLINENIYLNNSESFSSTQRFTPSSLFCYLKYDNDWKEFAKYLSEQGYKETYLPPEKVRKVSISLKEELRQIIDPIQASEVIFKHCFNLQTQPIEVKYKFIADNCTRGEFEKYFFEYLKLTDYKIKYKHRINIENFVSEAIPEILQYADEYGQIIVKAETGTGKTHAVINEIHKHRPNARILILAPLTMIVDQQAKRNKTGVYLTGKSEFTETEKALNSNLIFATYEQGTKFLIYSPDVEKIDYVIIDEAHNLITANSYKHKVILNLTQTFQNRKIIGLTATPLQIFNKLDFELIEIRKQNQNPTDVEVRICNKDPYKIAVNHLESLNGNSKAIFRLNSVDKLKVLKQKLIQEGKYKENEVIVFYSEKDIKNGADFCFLENEERFKDEVKIILTTSIIDEGVNIKQLGFTDVVYIETSYTPRPEAVKQFFARFRETDKERKNYLYLREKKNQDPTKYNPIADLDKAKSDIMELKGDKEVFTTSSIGIAGNYDKFIIDNTSLINLYYLAFSLTQNLFQYLNLEQYLYFLKVNYNIKISVNTAFELTTDTPTVVYDEVKKLVADIWLNDRITVLNTLYRETSKRKLKAKLTIQQGQESEANKTLVKKHLKRFEKLAEYYYNLLDLGSKKPDEVLIIDNTLNSDVKIKNEITILKLTRTQEKPNQTDLERLERIKAFVFECAERGSFSENDKNKLLRTHKLNRTNNIKKNDVLKPVFLYYGFEYKYNYKYSMISIKKTVDF